MGERQDGCAGAGDLEGSDRRLVGVKRGWRRANMELESRAGEQPTEHRATSSKVSAGEVKVEAILLVTLMVRNNHHTCAHDNTCDCDRSGCGLLMQTRVCQTPKFSMQWVIAGPTAPSEITPPPCPMGQAWRPTFRFYLAAGPELISPTKIEPHSSCAPNGPACQA